MHLYTLDGRAGLTMRFGGLNTAYSLSSYLLSPPSKYYLKFSGAGTNTPAVGDKLLGLTSGAYGWIKGVVLCNGSYAGGTGNGILFLDNITGTFQAENCDHTNGATDDLTIAGDVKTGPWDIGKAPKEAILIASTATMNVCLDGNTVTASGVNDGFPMYDKDSLPLRNPVTLKNLQWIDAAGGTTSIMIVTLLW